MDFSVEFTDVDQRYRHCRLSHGPSERRLLCSVAEEGIRDPLLGFMRDGSAVLLDGFKRLRCAKKLGINQVPFRSLGADEAVAIIALMRLTDVKRLNFIEQAYLIDELRRVHRLTVAEISRRLEKSTGWVSSRCGLTAELTPLISGKLMSGAFPIYAYLTSVRPFMRMNKVQLPEIEKFLQATSSKGLSVRDLDMLARGYFQGGEDFRRHVQEGDVRWCLETLRPSSAGSALAAANDSERKVLVDMEAIQQRVRRLVPLLQSEAACSAAFLAEANLLCSGLLRVIPNFTKSIKDFYARTRPQDSDCSHACEEGGQT